MSKNKVELVAKTVPLVEGVDTAGFAAYVARIGKVKDNPEKLTNYLIKHKHWSPFQHTYFSFKIRTSRAMGREILRHWSMDQQELSQRYEEVLEFEPIELRMQSENNRQSSTEVFDPTITFYEDVPYQEGTARMITSEQKASDLIANYLEYSRELYKMLLEAGVARECARFILPECTSTTMLLTGNIRSWIHFLDLRDDARAQKEIQLIAGEIREILAKEIPTIFSK